MSLFKEIDTIILMNTNDDTKIKLATKTDTGWLCILCPSPTYEKYKMAMLDRIRYTHVMAE